MKTPAKRKSAGSKKATPKSRGISSDQQAEIIELLNDFLQWLMTGKIVQSLSHIDHIVDLPFANEDWVMRVDEKKRTVSFNTYVTEKCSLGYFKSILIHELFHLVVQRVPNKEDAVRVKDDFGDELMKLIDIEADYFTALYFKEKLGYGIVDYLKLYYEGSKVFADPRIRAIKFERFIGTLLSISKMFLNFPKASQKVSTFDLYLPTISPIYTENSLHVLVIRREHIYFDEIQASYQDFVELKECYTKVETFSEKGYIERLINFVCKAFKIEVPEKVQIEINNL